MSASISPLRQSEATSRWGASEYVWETIPTGMGRSAARAQRPAAPVLRPRLQRADFDNIGSFIFNADMIISTCTLTGEAWVPGPDQDSSIRSQGELDLNTASVKDLSRVSGVNVKDLERLVENRPYRDWDHVRRASSLDEASILKLQSGGVIIGT